MQTILKIHTRKTIVEMNTSWSEKRTEMNRSTRQPESRASAQIGPKSYSRIKTRNEMNTRFPWKKKRNLKKFEKSLRQINDHLRWVSTNRNVRIALSFTTLGSIKVVYSWFESVAQHHIFTQLITIRIEPLKILCIGIEYIFASYLHNRSKKSSLLGGILT